MFFPGNVSNIQPASWMVLRHYRILISVHCREHKIELPILHPSAIFSVFTRSIVIFLPSPQKSFICETVYDVTRRDTFTNLSDIWAKEIDLYSTNQDCIKMLVGNKVDKVLLL